MNGSPNIIDVADVDLSSHTNETVEVEVEWGSNGTIAARIYDPNDVAIGALIVSDTTYSSGGVGFHVYDGSTSGVTAYFDNWRIIDCKQLPFV